MSLLDPVSTLNDGNHQKPGLLFAGEAFHPIHYSTTHGAFESGRDQAGKVIQWRSLN